MMHFFGIILWITFLESKGRHIYTFVFMGLLLALILTTRRMGLIYILAFLIMYIFIIFNESQKHQQTNKLLVITASFIFFFLLINFTSLVNGYGLSFDDKILKGSVNWAQWDYHNAMLIDQGEQERFFHVDIAETEEYIRKNGDNSLPTTFFEMIIFDIALTIKEFFIDFAMATKYFVRQTGLWPFLFIFFLAARLRNIKKKRSLSQVDFVYLFSLFCYFLFCFIVITNIQMRWFTFFVPIMFLLMAKDFENINPFYQKLFFIINNLLLILMAVPFWTNILM